MRKAEYDKISSIYWQIRKAYPLCSWHDPESEFERKMQDIIREFGDFLNKTRKEIVKNGKKD
jgi:maltooligosyltrehalose synthase